MKRHLSYLVGWLLILIAVVYLVRRPEIVQSLRSLSATTIGLLVLLSVGVIVANGFMLRSLCLLVGVRLDLPEWLGIPAANSMYNLVLPVKGGIIAKGYYLKRQHGMSAPVFLVQTAAGTWSLVGAAIFLLATAATILRTTESERLPFPILFASLVLLVIWCAVTLVSVFPTVSGYLQSEQRRPMIRQIAAGIRTAQAHPRTLLSLLVATFAVLIIGAARLYIACLGLGFTANPVAALAVQALVTLSFVVSITPGNLGIKEGITVASAGLLGLSTEEAVLAALVDRAAATIVVIALGGVYSRILARRIEREGSE